MFLHKVKRLQSERAHDLLAVVVGAAEVLLAGEGTLREERHLVLLDQAVAAEHLVAERDDAQGGVDDAPVTDYVVDAALPSASVPRS